MSDQSSPCPCGAPQDPQVILNPPGLGTIAYRVDDFTGFRRALLRPLAGEEALGAWAPAPGDLGLQVLEWWAYLADVLTFYNERIANETYLRTAKSQKRLQNLVALIGYVPTPGIAATGQVAAIRTASHPNEPVSIPAAMPISSTATPGVASQVYEVQGDCGFSGLSDLPVTLLADEALVVNSVAGPASVLLSGRVPGVKPGDQLLLVELGWNGGDDNWSWVSVGAVAPAVDPATGLQNTLVSFTSGVRFGPQLAAVPDTAILRPDVAVSDVEAEHFVGLEQLDAVAPMQEAEVSFLSGLTGETSFAGSAASRSAAMDPGFAGDRLGVLGGLGSRYWTPNQPPSPPPTSSSPSPTTSYQLLRPSQTASLWNQNQSGETNVILSSSPTSLVVHLGASVRALSPGGIVLFDGGSDVPAALAMVTAASEWLWTIPNPNAPPPAPTPFEIGHFEMLASTAGTTPDPTPPIMVAHTAITVTTQDEIVLTSYSDLTTVALRYGFKSVGTIVGVPATNLPSLPATVGVPSSYVVPGGGTTAILEDATGAGVVVGVGASGDGQVLLSPSGATPATLAPALAVPLRLLLDLVPVSRGSTVASETIGSGNAAVAKQSFTLQRSPLTYLASGSTFSSTLVVRVNGIAWTEVRSFYSQASDAQVYTVQVATDGSATVTFGGDGRGARLPTGSGNVVARYRYGSGAASPPAGRLTTITKPQPNLASLANPVAVFGGADPQALEDMRTNAPASVFTFGRAISALDYEVVAAQAAGVTRASAVWGFDAAEQQGLVAVYVDGGAGAVAAAMAALAGAEDPNRPISVVGATAIELSLSCTLVVAANRDPNAVQAAATAAVSDPDAGLFSPSSLGIGQRLYRSQVDAALSVDGVLAVQGLVVAGEAGELADVLDPGTGAYFTLSGVSIVSLTSAASAGIGGGVSSA